MLCSLSFLLLLLLFPRLAPSKVPKVRVVRSSSREGAKQQPKHGATRQPTHYHSRFRYEWYVEGQLDEFWRIHRTPILAGCLALFHLIRA